MVFILALKDPGIDPGQDNRPAFYCMIVVRKSAYGLCRYAGEDLVRGHDAFSPSCCCTENRKSAGYLCDWFVPKTSR